MLIELGGVRLLTDPVLRAARAPTCAATDPSRRSRRPSTRSSSPTCTTTTSTCPSLRMLGPGVRVLVATRVGALPRPRGPEAVDGAVARTGHRGRRGSTVAATPAEHDPRRRPLGRPERQPVGLSSSRPRNVGVLRRATPTSSPAWPTSDRSTWRCCRSPGWGPKLGAGHLDPSGPRVRPRWFAPGWPCRSTGARCDLGRQRGAWFTDPPHDFAAQAGELAPEVEVRVLSPGESLEL